MVMLFFFHFRDAFQVCSGAAETIAREHVQMLVDIENDVCKPMQEIEVSRSSMVKILVKYYVWPVRAV